MCRRRLPERLGNPGGHRLLYGRFRQRHAFMLARAVGPEDRQIQIGLGEIDPRVGGHQRKAHIRRLAAIAREARGETETAEFLFPPRADLEAATAEGDKAVAKIRFLAELRSQIAKTSGEGEPVIEERRTAEHWTFERVLGAADPNWVLARVEPASA